MCINIRRLWHFLVQNGAVGFVSTKYKDLRFYVSGSTKCNLEIERFTQVNDWLKVYETGNSLLLNMYEIMSVARMQP